MNDTRAALERRLQKIREQLDIDNEKVQYIITFGETREMRDDETREEYLANTEKERKIEEREGRRRGTIYIHWGNGINDEGES